MCCVRFFIMPWRLISASIWYYLPFYTLSISLSLSLLTSQQPTAKCSNKILSGFCIFFSKFENVLIWCYRRFRQQRLRFNHLFAHFVSRPWSAPIVRIFIIFLHNYVVAYLYSFWCFKIFILRIHKLIFIILIVTILRITTYSRHNNYHSLAYDQNNYRNGCCLRNSSV